MSVSYPSSQLWNLYLHHNIFTCIIWDEVFLVEILSDFRELSLCLCIIYMCVCLHVQSCLTLCDPMDWSLPGSSVHGTLQARKLEQFAISSFRGSSDTGIVPASPALADKFFTATPPTHAAIHGVAKSRTRLSD